LARTLGDWSGPYPGAFVAKVTYASFCKRGSYQPLNKGRVVSTRIASRVYINNGLLVYHESTDGDDFTLNLPLLDESILLVEECYKLWTVMSTVTFRREYKPDDESLLFEALQLI